MDWRNVSGGRSRQLLRNLEHTAAVHGFLAALARQARALGWDTAQLDPPHRASRHFRHQGALRSVNPDAFGVLRRGPAAWAFFLEWERRAVRPATMTQRLAPYLRYYSSHRPTDDHGTTARRPRRLRRRHSRHPLPGSGGKRDGAGRGEESPCGCPTARPSTALGPPGKGLAHTRRLGTGQTASRAIRHPYNDGGKGASRRTPFPFL